MVKWKSEFVSKLNWYCGEGQFVNLENMDTMLLGGYQVKKQQQQTNKRKETFQISSSLPVN